MGLNSRGIVECWPLTLTNSAVSGNSGINQSGGILNFALWWWTTALCRQHVYSLGASKLSARHK